MLSSNLGDTHEGFSQIPPLLLFFQIFIFFLLKCIPRPLFAGWTHGFPTHYGQRKNPPKKPGFCPGISRPIIVSLFPNSFFFFFPSSTSPEMFGYQPLDFGILFLGSTSVVADQLLYKHFSSGAQSPPVLVVS